MTRWMQPPELGRDRERAECEPVIEGRRHGLSREVALALWERACTDATDRAGVRDEAQARRQFHELAARVVARGGRLGPDVGRTTRVGVEHDGEIPVVSGLDEGSPRAPGRETLVAAEARRWAPRGGGSATVPGGAGSVPPRAPSGRHQGPAAFPAPVMRSAERTGIDPDAADLVARALRGGVPLDEVLRSKLEAALGVGLDGVRVHTGADADAAARALGARAFALGNDVVFRDGAYDPQRRDGQRLIAHEVAHTVQARGAAAPTGGATAVSQPCDAPEREADAFADAFILGMHGAGLAPRGSGSGLAAFAVRDAPVAPSVVRRAPDPEGFAPGQYVEARQAVHMLTELAGDPKAVKAADLAEGDLLKLVHRHPQGGNSVFYAMVCETRSGLYQGKTGVVRTQWIRRTTRTFTADPLAPAAAEVIAAATSGVSNPGQDTATGAGIGLGTLRDAKLPDGVAPLRMADRHVLDNLNFFKAVKSGPESGNSYLENAISDEALAKLYVEATNQAVKKGVKTGEFVLQNGQKWSANLTTGKFFPVEGPGIVQLTQQEVRLLEQFVNPDLLTYPAGKLSGFGAVTA